MPSKNSPSPVFAALGDDTRLRIVSQLVAEVEPQPIVRLRGGSRISRQAITKHLRVLQKAGIVRCERRGRESLFSIDPKPLRDLQAYLDAISARWDESLARLRDHVDGATEYSPAKTDRAGGKYLPALRPPRPLPPS